MIAGTHINKLLTEDGRKWALYYPVNWKLSCLQKVNKYFGMFNMLNSNSTGATAAPPVQLTQAAAAAAEKRDIDPASYTAVRFYFEK